MPYVVSRYRFYVRCFITVLMLFANPLQATVNDAQPSMTEQQFLAHVKVLNDGSDTTLEMNLALINTLESHVHRFSDATQRQFNRMKCWYLYAQGVTSSDPFFDAQLAEARAAADQHAEADFLNCQGVYLFYEGDPEAALHNYQASLKIAYQLDDRRLIADGYTARGELNSYLGNLGTALEDLLQAQLIFDELQLPYYSAYNLSVIANTYRRMKAYQPALKHYDRLYELFQDAVDRKSFQSIRLQQAMIYQDMGQLDTALDIVQAVYQYYQKQNDDQGQSEAATYLASIYNDRGEYQQALEFGQQAELLSEHPELDPQLTRLYIGQALAGLQRLDEALEALADAEASFLREDNLRFLSELYRAEAQVYRQLGNWQQAFERQRQYTESFVTLTEKQNEQHSARLRIDFDFQRTHEENQHLKDQQELTDAKLAALATAARWQRITMLMGAILLLALAVIGARYFLHARRMQALALTDPLTNLPNRRHIEEAGLQMLARCHTHRQTCALLIMDIDNFKQINDTFGHDTGDQVLQRLSKIAQETVRAQDVLGRVGGEEFLVLLPATSRKQAGVIAERLRQAIEQMNATDIVEDLAITTSIGVAQMNSHYETLSQLTTRADNALYAAKASGRNRVELAP
ncbi:GGDEF domain-containing protein [Neiella marina]|uniref:diguanylate cyclase n=1 Tax=Neiella holothuriorum TaxID=2870530 RepID=A0ABS7EFD0_9GAMM|nr:diguanylate cyclase [Neiella holothuriorum]MBW8191043.1 GGDEF domain-containing protein [Neiella holothuriorum]